jgi:hypothetical protein
MSRPTPSTKNTGRPTTASAKRPAPGKTAPAHGPEEGDQLGEWGGHQGHLTQIKPNVSPWEQVPESSDTTLQPWGKPWRAPPKKSPPTEAATGAKPPAQACHCKEEGRAEHRHTVCEIKVSCYSPRSLAASVCAHWSPF